MRRGCCLLARYFIETKCLLWHDFLRCSSSKKFSVSKTSSLERNNSNVRQKLEKVDVDKVFSEKLPSPENGKNVHVGKKTNSTKCKSISKNENILSKDQTNSRRNDDIPTTSAVPIDAETATKAFNLGVSCHQFRTLSSLRDLVDIIDGLMKTHNTVPPRVVYLAMDLALRLNQLDVAENLCKLMPGKVHILATSLRIRLFAAQLRFKDALTEMEKVLNEEVPVLEVRFKISNFALDELYRAIVARTDTHDEIRRFRYLQRVLTKYSRRTNADFILLLYSPVYTRNSLPPEPVRGSIEIDEKITEKIRKLSPYILCDDE